VIRRLALLAWFAAVGLLPRWAPCAETRRRVALVHPDAHLIRSTVIALSAWDIDVVGVEVPAPGASLPLAQRNAENIARQTKASAVGWLSESSSGCVLWIYDVDTHNVESRVLDDSPPFDEPTAAAIALSIKALLRSSSIAPEPERVVRLQASPAASSSQIWVEMEAGGRAWPSAIEEPRGALGVSLWPRGLSERVGIEIGVSDGLGAAVTTPGPTSVNARFSDFALSSSLRTHILLSARFALEPALGTSVHLTSVAGTAGLGAVPVVAHQLCGSLDAALSFEVRVGSVGFAARASMEYLPSYPRYLVYGHEVLSLDPWVLGVALRVRAGLW
jgi:hypothetical protein